jgi:MFS family permease
VTTRADLLAAALMTPLYAKLADLIGRKPCLYFVIGLFVFGSAMCGAAQSIVWLDVCRAVQGGAWAASTAATRLKTAQPAAAASSRSPRSPSATLCRSRSAASTLVRGRDCLRSWAPTARTGYIGATWGIASATGQ